MKIPAALSSLSSDRPVLIAGPTASGKSALAMALAQEQGGVVVNADAMQVYAGWRILSARPSPEEMARVPHALYGHVPLSAAYSVGAWLADVTPLLTGRMRPIITGGTGLYFSALTQGLAGVPGIPPEVRKRADSLSLGDLLREIDQPTRARIDTSNRARVQRAWEVLAATGRGLAAWQADTPAPCLPLDRVTPIVLEADPVWLEYRIVERVDAMLSQGAVEEARRILPGLNPLFQSSRIIGATELVAHLRGELSLEEARKRTILATRRYAKRQRTWFRNRMKGWTRIPVP
jgi:tRNA dimethylallyltransferase